MRRPMNYTVKLAIFPPWKAPVPCETLAGVFTTIAEAAEAGTKALARITEHELVMENQPTSRKCALVQHDKLWLDKHQKARRHEQKYLRSAFRLVLKGDTYP